MTSNHKAENIKKMTYEILADYEISEDQICRFRTDNGSNRVAAFRESHIEMTAKILDKDFSEPTAADIDNNFDESFDEFAIFDELSTEFKRAFPKWLDCVAHSIQLPLRKVIDSDPDLAEIRLNVFSLLKKFSKSEKATRSLKLKCGKKLVMPGITRWNTLCLAYDRLLEIRESVDEVCMECGWATLGETYEKLETVRDLLKPFLDFTNFLQGEQYPTISSIIPTLLNLLMDLELPEPSNRWATLGNVPALLAVGLRERFSHVIGFQQTNIEFDSTYLVTTFLDPNTAFLLSRMEQKLAKRELLIMMHKSIEDEALGHNILSNMPISVNKPIATRFARLAQVASVTHQLEMASEPVKSLEDEVSIFMNTFAQAAPTDELDVIEFWKGQKNHLPRMTSLAFDLLSIPATSAAVERIFSQAGLATSGRKGQTGPVLLQLDCFLKYNKKYFMKNINTVLSDHEITKD